MISLKQLTYALAVEQTLHFKKAAERCHISQSALSTALNELEKQLGLQVFERDNKKVLVTPQGQEVLERARSIMLQVDELQNLAANQMSPLAFPLTVGVIPTIAPYLLPKLLPLVNEEYPQAQLTLLEEQSHVLVDRVRRGEIDAAILALPFDCEGLLALEFWQEDFYWVASADAPHAQQTEITSEEIDAKGLLLLQDGHCLKDHALDACKLPQTSAHGFAATSLTTLVYMVMGNLGTTLVPAMALEQLVGQTSQLAAVHLNEPGPHRRLAFIIRPNYTRLPSIDALKALCVKGLSENGGT